MTFQGTLKYVSYAGNDVTTSFAFNDKINDEAQLEVRISDPGNPEITVPDDSYTVTIDPGTGFATVDLDVAPSSIQTLFIRRAARNQQDTNWPLAGVINSEAANKQFDGDAMDRLSVQRQLDQAVKSNTTDFDGTFQPEASGFLAVTVDGKGIETLQGVPPDPSEIPAKSITSDKLADITATGTTTARAIEDRFADSVNVKDFGAVGDGVTADTAAIQAALDSGNKVIGTKGAYRVTAPLILPNGLVWEMTPDCLIQRDFSDGGSSSPDQATLRQADYLVDSSDITITGGEITTTDPSQLG